MAVSNVPRLHRQVMELLLSDIGSGALRPGAQLPSEADLAKRFGVSRGVVRESIRGLEERGLVEVRQGRGAIVTDSASWDVLDADVMSALVSGGEPSTALAELLHCRRLIEIDAAGLAAELATGEQLTRMSEAYAKMVDAAKRSPITVETEQAFQAADIEFHRCIVDASHNRVLVRLIEPIQRTLRNTRPVLSRPEERIEGSLPEHRRILSAIAAGDAEAAQEAMADHLATVKRHLDEYAADRHSREALGRSG
jgi:GntR family transcriptional repressor for pyruvate dehydrogenase complex